MFRNETPRQRISPAQWTLSVFILALAIAGALYRVFVWKGLEQTAALFIGLPAVLAIVLTLSPRPKSAMGIVMKGITIALLMSGPVFGEGFICVVMTAPLFYLVGAIIAWNVDRARQSRKSHPLRVIVLLPILMMSLEGTTPSLSFPRRETVTVTKIVHASPEAIEQALAQQPRFENELPPFLRLRFPRPVATSGEGLAIGATRRIRFARGEGKPGDLTLRVTSRDASSVTFSAESDTSNIARWLTWRTSHVAWREVAPGRSQVTWTLVYDRELDPAWYFGPWERYAMGLAAEVLIDEVASPR